MVEWCLWDAGVVRDELKDSLAAGRENVLRIVGRERRVVDELEHGIVAILDGREFRQCLQAVIVHDEFEDVRDEIGERCSRLRLNGIDQTVESFATEEVFRNLVDQLVEFDRRVLLRR